MSAGSTFTRNKTFLAAAFGAGIIVGAAGLYIYNSLEQRKKFKLLEQTLARLDLSFSEFKQKLSTLEETSDSNRKQSSRRQSISSKKSKRSSLSSSRVGYETEDDMFSALNTDDDDEFYDINSDDEVLMRTLSESGNKSNENGLFEEVDILMKGNDEDRLNAFNLLKKNEFELSENADFLWRLAKAHQMQAVVCGAQKDMTGRKKHVFEGLEYATKALSLDVTNPDVHKWFAILTGMQGDFVSIKERIQNGYLFQKHVLVALQSKPEDYSLHYLLGRFKFEVANTSWVEKKVASSLFAEVPALTFSDAIADLLTAEELNPTPWKENRLLLAKCYIGDGKYDKGIEWLDSAKEISARTKEVDEDFSDVSPFITVKGVVSGQLRIVILMITRGIVAKVDVELLIIKGVKAYSQDQACDVEINTLIEKYKKYRK